MIVFMTVTQLPAAVVVFVQCRPVQKLWNPTIQGECWRSNVTIAAGDFNGAVSTLSDWVLATLPIFFLWNVQMSSKLKAVICCLMGMGFFSGICTIVRTVYYQNIYTEDVTWQVVDVIIWASLALWVGIIAACIPTLKPLFREIKHSLLESKCLGWRCFGSKKGKEGPDLRLAALPPATAPYSRIGDRNYTEVSTGVPQARLQGATDGVLKQQEQDPEVGVGSRHPVRMVV